MKRENTKYNNVAHETVYNHYGLFIWQECLFCEKEFRRESGYRFQIQVNRGWVYSCATCCNTKEDVNSKMGDIYSTRPKAPCAPPKREVDMKEYNITNILTSSLHHRRVKISTNEMLTQEIRENVWGYICELALGPRALPYHVVEEALELLKQDLIDDKRKMGR